MLMVSVDIGGTFTDIVIIENKNVGYYKVPTTPKNPEIGVINGLKKYLNGKRIDEFLHATTIATNSLLGQYGLELPKVALLTTYGFKDIIEIGRQNRPELYNLNFHRPRVLVPGNLRYEVNERTDVNGKIIESVKESEIKNIAEKMLEKNVESVAVCYLHSYKNPDNEILTKNIIEKRFKNVSISSEISPEPREYERMSTTVVNAALSPVISNYVRNLERSIKDFGDFDIKIMSNAGGLIFSNEASEKPVNVIESGPAAGVIAASEFAKIIGINNVISFDMGGTTAKAGTVLNGNFEITSEYEVGGLSHHGRIIKGSGYPVRFPFIDLSEVSAGGGTVIWMDSAGGLNIGPWSAGSDPGPVCYNRGGKYPTITDSNLVLGIIGDKMSGSDFKLRRDLSLKALSKLGNPYEIAEDAVRLAILEMARGIRLVTVERGLDPSDFTLFGFGGAGPQFAVRIAEELGIKRVIIPPAPGVFSALGLAYSDMRYEARKSYPEDLEHDFDALKNKLMVKLKNPGFIMYADCRYHGQGSELTVPVNEINRDKIIHDFENLHYKTFGFRLDRPVDIVTIRVFAVEKREKPRINIEKGSKMFFVNRKLYINGSWVWIKVYSRNSLIEGENISGPCVIEENGSSTFIPKNWNAHTGKNNEIVVVR
ncbi:hydantoinase/oxoprolinase family protein [Picrophilus oshimae]|uniref:N-methylhydantoinase n=1 Tax=Picrophilus torridus (strain ATCC 700027 / DSM 9790 / JCM 10055 / NBRC 100828 / KAW 2/3) TaxID=1122961 RepID=Q6L1V5_PICTO|nr:hydantoinase/oxoprolinase family protein [Picrophilus oshimae]AAT43047.1 N-methylhydantoinase [Picrophilus oshimae DSM 9789]